jgi:hypothetical protein
VAPVDPEKSRPSQRSPRDLEVDRARAKRSKPGHGPKGGRLSAWKSRAEENTRQDTRPAEDSLEKEPPKKPRGRSPKAPQPSLRAEAIEKAKVPIEWPPTLDPEVFEAIRGVVEDVEGDMAATHLVQENRAAGMTEQILQQWLDQKINPDWYRVNDPTLD